MIYVRPSRLKYPFRTAVVDLLFQNATHQIEKHVVGAFDIGCRNRIDYFFEHWVSPQYIERLIIHFLYFL